MASSTPTGLLAKISAGLGKLVAWLPVGVRPTNKWVAHAVVTGLSAAAVALLPLDLSTQLNGIIVVAAGLIAHYVVPNEPAA